LADKDGTYGLIFKLLTQQGWRHWKGYALGLSLMAVAAGCTGLTAYLIGRIVNETYVYQNFAGIVAICVATIVMFTAKGFATYGQTVVMAYIANAITAENQRRLFDKLLQESVGYFADRHSSEFTARVMFCAGSMASVLNLLITAAGRDVLALLSLSAVMVIQDPVMSLIALVVMPPAVIAVRKLVKRVRHITLTQFSGTARILEALQDTVQGMRTIKAFGLEEEMQRRVHDSVADVQRATNKLTRVANRSGPLMESLGGFAVAGVFLYGGYRVLFEMLDAPPSEPADDHLPALEVKAGKIEFDNVEFAYRPGEPVLKGMSLVAEPGKVTALVGRSGGGKTTVLNLLLRLYEIDRGSIRIDGQDMSGVTRKSVRQQIAYVGQDIFLFRGSVRENIALGRPQATDEQIVAAAQAAYAHDFIQTFPKGYDTPVGELGVQLSGGQRQRIAVARALIRNAHIILLDEPTASLDSESEQFVQEAVARLCENRTTLVVAHRLHTITSADRIYVIEDGIAVESGRHDALMRKGGRYASYFGMQFRTGAERSTFTSDLVSADEPSAKKIAG
jgi:ATP-binding cassette subfamily B protein